MQQFQFGSRKPMSPPAKIALLAFGVVLFLPIFALLLVAAIFGGTVFVILFVCGMIKKKIRCMTTKGDMEGRRNVRIKK